MTAVFALPDADIPPDVPDASTGDSEPLRCQSDGCTNAVVKPARGRTPKYCPEHRKNTGTPSGRKAASWPRAEFVEEILNRYAAGLAFTVTLVNVEDGSIVANGMPAVIHEFVELGRIDKNIRKYLEMISTPGKYGPLAIASATVVIPIMANHGLLPQFLINMKPKGVS